MKASWRTSVRCRRHLLRSLAVLASSALAGCSNPQSTLAPAGIEAEQVARLFWVMAIGAAIVWLAVIGFALYASRANAERHGPRQTRWLILGGGVVTPTLVLGALLLYGLQMMPELRQPGAPGGHHVEVSGEQWWWRVRYVRQPGAVGAETIAVELANEIRLPVGRRTEFLLSSPDVIHSFWIPSLAGKVDMIPGRVTRLVLEPTRSGTFRGVCAEYCGASHAHMEFVAVVMEHDAFERWLEHQARPAAMPTTAIGRRGMNVFASSGCGACHTVRGTAADGPVGPDLTHVGSRLSLAAGTLPNHPDAFRRWVARTHAVKPEVLMPSFGMLPAQQLDEIALYLESLQ